MDTKPLGPFSEPDKYCLEKWRKGAPLDKRDIFILILSGLVLLIGILVGMMAITSDLFAGMEKEPAPIRNGTAQRLAWFGDTPNLTDDQRAQIRPILEDEHSRVFGPRQDSLLSPQEKRARFEDLRAKTLEQIRPLLTGDQQSTLRQIQKEMKGKMGGRRHREGGDSATWNE